MNPNTDLNREYARLGLIREAEVLRRLGVEREWAKKHLCNIPGKTHFEFKGRFWNGWDLEQVELVAERLKKIGADL